MLGFVVLKKLTNYSSFLIEEKKDDEELRPLELTIKRLKERHPLYWWKISRVAFGQKCW